MNRRRRAFFASVAVVTCLVIAWWALRSDESPVPPMTAVEAPHAEPQRISAAEATPEEVPAKPLAAFATLRGRVIDAATREPVREFELRFAEWGRSAPDRDVPAAQKFHTADGSFEWQRIPPGQWGLIAEASGYQRFLTDLSFVKNQATQEVIIPLVRGGILRGRIFDQASGVGIASAYISFRMAGQHPYEGNWRLRPSTKSQAGGAFVLNGIPPGRITLDVGANNYASRELDLVMDENTAPVEVGLSSGGLIAGRLAGPDGSTPVAGSAGIASVDGGVSYSSRTNDAGEFSFPNLAAGTYRVTGSGPGGSVTREFVLAESERMEGVILAVRGGRTVRGTITGLSPAELKALSILAHREDHMAATHSPAAINERGEYELRDVPPGRVRVAADVTMRRQLARSVTVPANTDVTVDFDFPRGARVSGRVTQRGRPIAGAWLEPRPTVEDDNFHNYGAATTASGEYVIEDLPAGEYTMSIQGFRSRPFQVAGDTVFDIDASPQLAGRILEDNGKVPITEAQLDIWPADPRTSRMRAFDRSDHYGRYAIAGLEQGELILTVYKPGFEMYRERIAYASPMLDMTIRLGRGTGVQVRAQDANTGKPLRGLSVYELLSNGRRGVLLSVSLDEQGVGQIPGGLAGATLALGTEGYAPQTISSWNGKQLDLKFAREQR
jgi:hypothetical protein